MGARELRETRFREILRRERENRGWSQARLAELLSAKGLGVHPTTIAKIEAGQRAARIDEVAGIADLFATSVDALLGRPSRGHRGGNKSLAFNALTDVLHQAVGQTELLDATMRNRLSGLDGLDLRKDELTAQAECERAADALADAVEAIRKAQRRVSPVLSRFAREFLFDDGEEGSER